MNILPKKRWHVRTKDNIARVRKDEAKAAEEEKSREQRAKFAEQEARTNALRIKARAVYDGREASEPSSTTDLRSQKEHVNFFKELEQELIAFTGTNAEYEREKKEEKEKYEKQIGFLTYLGQDTVETTGNVSWYNKVPNRLLHKQNKMMEEVKETEINIKSKQRIDPLRCIRKYTEKNSSAKNEGTKVTLLKDNMKSEKKLKLKNVQKDTLSCSKKKSLKKKQKNAAVNKSSKSDEAFQPSFDINKLRAKRLQREKEEKLRAERLLAKLRGETLPENKPAVPTVQQKYSSQFNPHLAKQNFDPERRFKK